jgi:hypothetical protein
MRSRIPIWAPVWGRHSWIAASAALSAACAVAASASPTRLVIALPVMGVVFVSVWARTREKLLVAGLADQLSFMSLLAATFTLTMNGVRVSTNVSLGDVFLTLAAVCLLVSLGLEDRRRPYVPWWLWVSLLALAISLLLAILFAPPLGAVYYDPNGVVLVTDPLATGKMVLPVVLLTAAYFVMPVTMGAIASTWPRVRLLAACWIAGATVNALVAIVDYFAHAGIGQRLTGLSFEGFAPTGILPRAGGLTTQPNSLGLICAMAAPIALSFAMTSATLRARAAGVAAVIVLFAATVISGSRSGLLAFGVGLVLVPALHSYRRGRIVWSAIAATCCGALFFARSGDGGGTTLIAIDRLAGSTATIQSDTLRQTFYSTALGEVRAHPLSGIGFQALRASHNLYLEFLQSGGVFALLSFVIFAIGTLGLGIRLSRRSDLDAEVEHLAAALVASTCAWLVCAIAQPAVYDRFLYLPVGLLFGLEVSFGLPQRRRREPALTGSGQGSVQ